MRILVLPLSLAGSFCQSMGIDICQMVREMYCAGQFDAMLLLTDENSCSDEAFPFATVYVNKISVSAHGTLTDAMKIAIGEFCESLSEPCFFAIVHLGDILYSQIAQVLRPTHELYFISLEDHLEPSPFVRIPLPSEENDSKYNFFAEKLTAYENTNWCTLDDFVIFQNKQI
ncbi:MAG: hypothetical protein LBI81_02600 [Puniceicoccales bacterium]|jgi:hypothetical protein|nr:hypothetical protein [Puniceicoccales bacterium]